MKKLIAVMMFIALTSPVFAEGSFVQRESDRSGVTGTLNMISNSIRGFFSSIGERVNPAK